MGGVNNYIKAFNSKIKGKNIHHTKPAIRNGVAEWLFLS